MAELADALDLGSSEATRTGSIPARCTRITKKPCYYRAFFISDFLFAIVSEKTKDTTKDIEDVPT